MKRISREQNPGALQDQLRNLEARLTDGYARIEHARATGLDVTAWEEFWIALLGEYEAAYDAYVGQKAA